MSNDQLRSALAKAGLDVAELADQAGVDAKTAGRWLGGRVPHARYRTKVAHILNIDTDILWPNAAPTALQRDDRREIVAAYAHANHIDVPDWRTLLTQASEQIELLGVTLIEIAATPGITDLLKAKAAAGCQVRILIAHPESVWNTSLAHQYGQAEMDREGMTQLDHQLDEARHHLEPLAGHDGIDLRAHWSEPYNTILRFDDQMLIRLHLYAVPGTQTPLLHLQRRDHDGLFEQFAGHLDTIHHEASEPIQPNPDLYGPPGEPAAHNESIG
jgi:transcriptional regulator with XRE-family HTH domain